MFYWLRSLLSSAIQLLSHKRLIASTCSRSALPVPPSIHTVSVRIPRSTPKMPHQADRPICLHRELLPNPVPELLLLFDQILAGNEDRLTPFTLVAPHHPLRSGAGSNIGKLSSLLAMIKRRSQYPGRFRASVYSIATSGGVAIWREPVLAVAQRLPKEGSRLDQQLDSLASGYSILIVGRRAGGSPALQPE